MSIASIQGLARIRLCGLFCAAWGLLAAASATGAPPAGPVTSTAADTTGRPVIAHCQVFLIQDTQVPAGASGVLEQLLVREGDVVSPGALLARLDDRQAQFDKLAAELKRDAAFAKSGNNIEVRFSQAALGVAEAELTQNTEINRHAPGTISTAEIRRLQLTREKAQLQIDRSQFDLKLAAMTADVETTSVAAADDTIERHQIKAPFGGMVLEILREEAEWVNAGEPVLRLISLDQLRVEGFVDVRQFNPEELADRPVTVAIQRARGQLMQLPGKVVFVSPLVQAGDKYRVRAEVQNQLYGDHWLLRPGMTAAMTIHAAPASGAAAPLARQHAAPANR